jgi:hypothetical protein
MSAWIKIFKDGSSEHGTDLEVDTGKASWTKGRLDSIVEVQISNKAIVACLTLSETEWYQFDRFIIDFDTQEKTRVFKVIQGKITRKHVGKYLRETHINTCMYNFFLDNKTSSDRDIFITKDMVDLWVGVSLPEIGTPCVCVSEKGKFRYGNK